MPKKMNINRVKHPLIRQLVARARFLDITIGQWGELGKVHPNTIRNAMSGRAMPSLDNLERMATVVHAKIGLIPIPKEAIDPRQDL